MRGSALVTTVLDSIATNIASSRPLRASSDLAVGHLAGLLGRGGGRRRLGHGGSIHVGYKVDGDNFIPDWLTYATDVASATVRGPRAGHGTTAGVDSSGACPGTWSRIACGSGDCLGFTSSRPGVTPPG